MSDSPTRCGHGSRTKTERPDSSEGDASDHDGPAAPADTRRASTPGLAARVSLGRAFRPVSTEFLLITSAALLLTGFGLVMVLSATSALDGGQNPFDHVLKQGVFAVVGIPLMFALSRAPMAFWKKIAWPVLI
ncbi:hypothetical protein RSA3_08510, partial [Microbacterium testaceum]